MRLWFDIKRPAPKGWTLVQDYQECCSLLATKEVTYFSFDDKFKDGKTGYDIILWMLDNQIFPQQLIQIHTLNPVSRCNMHQILSRHAPQDITISLKFQHDKDSD